MVDLFQIQVSMCAASPLHFQISITIENLFTLLKGQSYSSMPINMHRNIRGTDNARLYFSSPKLRVPYSGSTNSNVTLVSCLLLYSVTVEDYFCIFHLQCIFLSCISKFLVMTI